MSRRRWWWAEPVVGAGVLALLVWRLGTGPFVKGFDLVDARSVAMASAITVVTTVCSAWRWAVVARGLGLAVSLPSAVTAYYRSQFVNAVLPGGVLGDLHRGVRHGRDVAAVGCALRAVVWERVAGQVVQALIAVTVLIVLPSPMRIGFPVVLALVVAGVIAATVWVRRGGLRPTWATVVRTELRGGVLSAAAWPRIVVASAVVVAGHATVFLIAARTAGASAPVSALLPLAMVVLLAMSVPTNVAGWGPREGVAGWAFATAGLGSVQGVVTATVYGVLALAATLPGAVVLTWGRLGEHRRTGPIGSHTKGRSGDVRAPVHPVELLHVDRRVPRRRHREPVAALE